MGTPLSYIIFLKSSGPYTCWSFGPSLECLSHQTSSPSFLWVMVAKEALFTGPLHINAAWKVASMLLMWQLQPPPWHPTLSSFLRACGTHPCYWCSLRWVLLAGRVHAWAIFVTSKETFLLGPPSKHLQAHKNWAGSPFGTHVFSLDVVEKKCN